MTVRDLRELLMQFPDDAVIFEERGGESRQLNRSDVRSTFQVFDADSGNMIHTMDQQPSDPSLNWLSKCPMFIIFGAWS